MNDAADAAFRAYAEGFLTGEPANDDSIRLKIEHSFRVRDEALALADSVPFPPSLRRRALAAALLHDYGRFEQYRRYRTFRDDRSVDHARLSAELCIKNEVLADFTPPERGEILAAIRVHNQPALPPQLPAGSAALHLARLVRDADKLDIVEILLGELANPRNEDILLNLPPTELSPYVVDRLLRGEPLSYAKLASATDFVASKLGWSFDLNFPHSSREFRRRNYLERLMAFLPASETIEKVGRLCRARLEKDAERRYSIA